MPAIALAASPEVRPTIPEWNLALAHLQRAEDLNCVLEGPRPERSAPPRLPFVDTLS